MSLKQKLFDKIKQFGYLSIEEVETICRQDSKKISNGERRLRELRACGIEPVFHERGYIKGYKFGFLTVNQQQNGQLSLI